MEGGREGEKKGGRKEGEREGGKEGERKGERKGTGRMCPVSCSGEEGSIQPTRVWQQSHSCQRDLQTEVSTEFFPETAQFSPPPSHSVL